MTPTDRTLLAQHQLIRQLKNARTMLANYASYDERHGLADDAAYTRRRIVEIDTAIAAAEQSISPAPAQTNVIAIADRDPEYQRKLDAVAFEIGASA